MVVNFRTRVISRGTRKLTRTPTLNLKKKKKDGSFQNQAAQTNFNSMEIIQIIQEKRKMSLWSCFNNLKNAANMSFTI